MCGGKKSVFCLRLRNQHSFSCRNFALKRIKRTEQPVSLGLGQQKDSVPRTGRAGEGVL